MNAHTAELAGLEVRTEKARLMSEGVAAELLNCRRWGEGIQLLLNFLQTRLEAGSSYWLEATESGLELREYGGESAEKAVLTGYKEPLAEEAFSKGKSLFAPAPQPRRLVGEPYQLALPMPSKGVFLLGLGAVPDPGLLDALRSQLREAEVSLSWLSRLEQLQDEVGQERHRRLELEAWLEDLEQFVAGARDLNVVGQKVLTEFEQLLEASFPGSSRALLLPGRVADERARELVERLGSAERPVLIDDLGKSRLPPLGPQDQSLLAYPVAEQTWLLLGSPELGAFGRPQLDLAALFALQLASLLEALEAQRALEKSKAQLTHSSKLAAVGQLAAGMAHELNTPLATVLLELESLAMGGLEPDEMQSSLDKAVGELLRARDLVEKLLYYSRDAGKGERQVEVAQVVADTLELLKHPLSAATVTTDLQARPSAYLNAHHLQQILTNLLMNAAEAEATLIEVLVGASDGGFWLRVVDNGCGLEAETAERIFEPFFTTKPVGRGTGLGLSIARQLAEAQGGELKLVEGSGGTVFELRLPLRQ